MCYLFLYSIFCFHYLFSTIIIIQVMLVVQSSPASAGDIRDAGSILGSGRSPGAGHGNPLQETTSQENPMDKGAWQAKVHGVSQVGHDRSDLAHNHHAVNNSFIMQS